MLRSLYSGISGLRAHQTMLDVIGNNIANVNTVGFKAGRVSFSENLVQTIADARRPREGATGGINPIAYGLGVGVASIDNIFTQGNPEATGVTTDVAIQGEGFFVLREGQRKLYTRAGAFQFDAASQLVSPDGGILQGWTANASGTVDQGRAIGDITLNPNTMIATPTTTVTLDGNLPR